MSSTVFKYSATSQAKNWTSTTGLKTWWYPSWTMHTIQTRKNTPSLPALCLHLMKWCLRISLKQSWTTNQNRSVYRTEKTSISFLSSIGAVVWETILECKMQKTLSACSFNLFQQTVASQLLALAVNLAWCKTKKPKKKLSNTTIRLKLWHWPRLQLSSQTLEGPKFLIRWSMLKT